jgi:hypothetical protein
VSKNPAHDMFGIDHDQFGRYGVTELMDGVAVSLLSIGLIHEICSLAKLDLLVV